MEDFIKVPNIEALEAIEEKEQNKVVFVEDTEQYMIYHDDQWYPVEGHMTDEGLQLNIYELNKQIIAQFPDFDDEAWSRADETISKWVMDSGNKYHMLYGRELNYFTIFEPIEEGAEFDTFFAALKECLNFVGTIKAVDVVEDGSAIEIWAQVGENITCMYLFNYDSGVVTYAK